MALAFLSLCVLVALAAPLLPLADPARTELSARLRPPLSPGAVLGTDHLGRDLLSRLVYGTRLSLLVACLGSGTATLVGSALGLLAGYHGRFFDTLVMRTLDVLLAFPYLLLAIAIVAALGPGLFNATLAIALVNVPFFARTVRGVTLGLRAEPFVLAARIGGLSPTRVVAHELLPNVLPTILVGFAASVGWVLLETAGLSFLGLGAQPPQADLGGMLGQGRQLLAIAPHVSLLPGGLILGLVAAMNLLGDGLRDALDPRLAAGSTPTRPSSQECDPGGELATSPAARAQPAAAAALCEVRELSLELSGRWVLRRVSFQIRPGERVALVGESGSGKSLTARALLGLIPPAASALTGEVRLAGRPVLGPASEAEALRGRKVALVPQDPLGSLHPLFRVGEQVREMQLEVEPVAAERRVHELLSAVKLPQPAALARCYPHELSGGMRQRVALAMALSAEPDLLVLDEPTTALDVTTQAAILQLLAGLAQARGLSLLFVTHDLAVASQLCQRVLVMHDGCLVESGELDAVLNAPRHDYTRRLVQAARRKQLGWERA